MRSSDAELHAFLISKYSLDDLKTLCLNLGVAYDQLEGTTRDSLARELILYLKRNDRFEELQRLKRNQGKLKYPKNKTRRSANWNHKPDQLFISYAQRNTKRAHKLANDLRSRGYEVWIAPESISPGEDWEDAIERGLLESGSFLLLMSASAAESYWVQEETKVAFRLEQSGSMRVIPLDVSEAPSLPVWWTNRQHISFRNYPSGLAKLLDVLDEHSKPSENFALAGATPHTEIQVQVEVEADADAAEEPSSALIVSSDKIGFDESVGDELGQASDEALEHSLPEATPSIYDSKVHVDEIVKEGTEPEREVRSDTEQISGSVLPTSESDPDLSDPIASSGEAEPRRTVTSADIGRSNVRVWSWVVGLVVLAVVIVVVNSLLHRSNNDGEPDAGTPVISQTIEQDAESISLTQAVVNVTEDIGPTQRPTARIGSIPTPVPTLIPIQSWTNESEFSVAQGWDILVDADGESGFEDDKFDLTNKKQNLLYISLWDALGGNINDAVISVDLIEPGKSEAPNAAGLVFGWGPASEDFTYAFLVTKDGACEFRQENNNRWTRVSQGQISDFLQQKESHTVRVAIRDGHAYGFVDGLYCDDNSFPLYESGYIGVAALSGIDQEDGSKGYFDNARFANLP